jgi:hypothetical protein
MTYDILLVTKQSVHPFPNVFTLLPNYTFKTYASFIEPQEILKCTLNLIRGTSAKERAIREFFLVPGSDYFLLTNKIERLQ